MFVSDKISIVVGRGAESWQFFAFIFAAICGLGLTIIDDLVDRWSVRLPVKVVWFICSFYVFMVNAWVDNRLVLFLTWLKRQPQ